jgi:hypothetical protein
MDGRAIPPAKPHTYLQRAFRAFESVSPAPLTTRGLAAILHCEIAGTYNYIVRLKRMGKIKIVPGGTARHPAYAIVEGATLPPDDARGRKPSRPSTDASRWKPRHE